MISFERIGIGDMTYENQSRIGEGNVFQTPAWLNFVADVQKAEPVIAIISTENSFLGYFTGLISSFFGLRILGSPFRGWQTYFMGFNLLPGAPKREILQALPKFAFDELSCDYLEIIDPNLLPKDWAGLPYRVENRHFYGIDLSQSEQELFANMDHKGRNQVRKSIKNGVVVEKATDMAFADDYYAQYKDALAKHSLTPTYSLNTIKKMINFILPTGNLLLLRARNPEGECIATGIFLGMNKTAIFWGAASWRHYQQLLPNEAIAWQGMRSMKAWDIETLHYGEKCEHFKEKLGAKELKLYRLMKTKNGLLGSLLYSLMSPKSDKYRNWVLKRLSH